MDNTKRNDHKSKSRSPVINESSSLMCEVILLDPTQQNFKTNVNVSENGNILFDKVCNTLGGILEKDYFGLKYIDKHGQQQWLELNKSTYKQVKDKFSRKTTQLFSFRFKHYPRDPIKDLKQDLSKYLLYLQLRRDLYRGRLVGQSNDQYRLAALILQAEIGGYDMVDIDTIKITDLKILPQVNRKTEGKIMAVYETFKHLDSQEAEKLFLEEASRLETYGVEPIAVKDQKGNDLFVGITYDGVSTFNGSKKVHTFQWQNIIKLSFSHKLFMFQIIMDQKKHILGFKCENSHAACALWKWALDRKCFFTLDRASEARCSRSGGSLFRRKKSHIFAGRSQRELTKSCLTLQIIPQPQVVRAQSMMTLMKSSSSRSESANVNEARLQNGFDGYATLPRSQAKRSNISDSSDDGEISKKPFKDNSSRNKPTSAAIGAVLDFMQALKETPILQRHSRNNSITKLDDTNMDNNSVDSDKTKDDDESTFFFEMTEIVDRERASLKLSDPCNNKDDSTGSLLVNKAPTNADDATPSEQFLMAPYVVIYGFFVVVSILIGVVTIFYVHTTPESSSSSSPDAVSDIPAIYSQGWTFDALKKIIFKGN